MTSVQPGRCSDVLPLLQSLHCYCILHQKNNHDLQFRAEHGGAIGVGDLKCLNTDNFPWEKPHWRHGKRLFGVSWGELWNRWKRLYNCYVWLMKAQSHFSSSSKLWCQFGSLKDSFGFFRKAERRTKDVTTCRNWSCIDLRLMCFTIFWAPSCFQRFKEVDARRIENAMWRCWSKRFVW